MCGASDFVSLLTLIHEVYSCHTDVITHVVPQGESAVALLQYETAQPTGRAVVTYTSTSSRLLLL